MESTFGEQVRVLREQNGLLLRELAAKLDVDTSILSKIETNRRFAKRELVRNISTILKADYKNMMVLWFSDRVFQELKGEENIDQIIALAKSKLENGKK